MWKPWQDRDTARERRIAREHERTMQWRQCADCSFDITTGEGRRACSWYACPSMPEALDVFCPTCNYDFYTGEGAPECHDPPTCSYSREVAPQRVAAVEEWLAHQ